MCKWLGLSLLFGLFSLNASCQSIEMRFTYSNLDYLSADYAFQLGEKHQLRLGLRTHLNSNPENELFKIYYRDFQSFNIEQTIGIGTGYDFRILKAKDFSSIVSLGVSYFRLGMKSYKMLPYGSHPITQVPIWKMVLIENADSKVVIPVELNLMLKFRLYNQLSIQVFGGFGVVFNEDFSNEQYTFILDPRSYVGNFIWSVSRQLGVGLTYSFEEKERN